MGLTHDDRTPFGGRPWLDGIQREKRSGGHWDAEITGAKKYEMDFGIIFAFFGGKKDQ